MSIDSDEARAREAAEEMVPIQASAGGVAVRLCGLPVGREDDEDDAEEE